MIPLNLNNNIHLKLYITDNEAYVTSSNLTKGGFEDNIELTASRLALAQSIQKIIKSGFDIIGIEAMTKM